MKISVIPCIGRTIVLHKNFSEKKCSLYRCEYGIFHIPLFTTNSFHYVPWKTYDWNISHLHYKSLNVTPPLHFNNSTLQSFDKTFRLLDGRLTTQLASLKQDYCYEIQLVFLVWVIFMVLFQVRRTKKRFSGAQWFMRETPMPLSTRLHLFSLPPLHLFTAKLTSFLPRSSLKFFPFSEFLRFRKRLSLLLN